MPERLDKHDTLLRIIYYLIIIIFLGVHYETSNDVWFFYMELLTAYMLFMTVFRYILTYKYKPRQKVQKKTPKRPTTPLDKEFERNYKKINKKYTHREPASDAKTEYIESAWEELKKH